jgi:hypothetical protein
MHSLVAVEQRVAVHEQLGGGGSAVKTVGSQASQRGDQIAVVVAVEIAEYPGDDVVGDVGRLRERQEVTHGTVVVASNAEYGVVKEFGVWEETPGVPGLDLPNLDVVATAASYGVDAREAHSTDEVVELVRAGIEDRGRPTLINARTTHVGA